MSAELRTQLAAYGDLFAAELDAATVEDAVSTRLGEGKVKALEPVRRLGNGDRNRKGVLLAATVFVVVVAVGLALALAWRGSGREVVEIPAPPFETGEEAATAFLRTLASGDYGAFNALFAPEVPNSPIRNFLGGVSATEQRRQERFEYLSLLTSPSPSNLNCVDSPVPDAVWVFCTSPWQDQSESRLIAAAGLTGDFEREPIAVYDIVLSPDGRLDRVFGPSILGVISLAGEQPRLPAVDQGRSRMYLAIEEWLVANYPDFSESLRRLYFSGDHEFLPLLMTPAEMAEQWQTAVEEYLANLGDQ